jgi:hypothetical protein
MMMLIAVLSFARSPAASAPSRRRTSVCSRVAKTGLIADGFNKPADCYWSSQTSPNAVVGRSWLVTAIKTTSGFAALYESALTITPGRLFKAL